MSLPRVTLKGLVDRGRGVASGEILVSRREEEVRVFWGSTGREGSWIIEGDALRQGRFELAGQRRRCVWTRGALG